MQDSNVEPKRNQGDAVKIEEREEMQAMTSKQRERKVVTSSQNSIGSFQQFKEESKSGTSKTGAEVSIE